MYTLVKVEPNRPTVAHILEKVNKATGIELALASNLTAHAPDLGYINPNKDGHFAFHLLEMLAKVEIKNARWEKTASGYRLEGDSIAPAGRNLVMGNPTPNAVKPKAKPPEVETPPAVVPEQPSTWLLVSGIVLGLVAAGLVTWFVMSKRKPVAEVSKRERS